MPASIYKEKVSRALARVFRHRAVSWACGSLEPSQVEYCFESYVSDQSSARLDCLSWSFRNLPKWVPEASQDIQNRFQKGLSMPSKRKCVLSGLWDEFGTRLGHPLGGHLGRKNGLEAIQNRFLFTTKLKHRFRRVWNGFWNEL